MYQLHIALALLLVPSVGAAQEVSFLIEEVHASSEVEVQDPTGLSGRQAREYRERLQQQYEAEAAASSVQNIIEEDVATSPIDTVSSDSSSSDSSDASSVQPVEPYYEPTPASSSQPYTPPSVDQEEQDQLTLEQLEEYADEANTNLEEQIALLEEGFSITSTSSLGSPLTTGLRSAILRRNVRTVPQLKLFARALAESDPDIRKITVEENTVTVSHRKKAWVFGFIPFNYILETTVEDGSVSVDKPWWLLLSRDDVDEHVESIEKDISEIDDLEDGLQGLLKRMQRMMEILSTL